MIKGIKQNKIKVNLYSYKQPKINPTIKTEILIIKAPKIVSINVFNWVVSIERRVKRAPGELISKSKNDKWNLRYFSKIYWR